MARDDFYGMFWQDPQRTRAAKGPNAPRALPATPDTGWFLPEGPELFPDLRGQGMIAFDVESCDPYLASKGPGYVRGDAYIAGVAVGTEAGFRRYYPVAHENSGRNLSKRAVFGWLREVLDIPVPKIGANLLYDLEALHFAGVPVRGPYYDVQNAEALLDETRLTYSLESIAQDRLGEGKQQTVMLKWLTQAFGNESNIKKNIWRAPPEVVGPYAESDVDIPLRLFAAQRPVLHDEGLWELFELESKLVPMLLAMRIRGVPVDIAHTEKLLAHLDKTYDESIDHIQRQVGFKPDIWAAESLAKVFDKFGVEYPRTPKTGAPSFRKEWLAQQNHPVANMIKEARNMDKFRGTFVKGYILDGHVNGRIHTQFHQLRSDDGGTVSGRFSSSNPNLQNIPTRTAEGKLIREAFIAEQGQDWWSLDWSQIEYRLIVHYAALLNLEGIQPIVDSYWNDANVDYHQEVAKLTGLSRSDAKNLNFGLAYGQGVDLLCSNLGVDRATGEAIMAEYHSKAPFIRQLANKASERAGANGYITTLLGRRRRFNTWERGRGSEFLSESNLGMFKHALDHSKNSRVIRLLKDVPDDERVPSNKHYLNLLQMDGYRRYKLHKALNALIQGSAADIMKKAMVLIWESGVCDVIGAPHLTVHDELDGSYVKGDPKHEEALAEVKNIMENCHKFRIPIRADGETGANWGAAKG